MGGLLWNIGAFIVALGLLVAVHEFGHFWVARRCGVKVERFSIGFGKAIWRRLGKDGTEYVLALIPLGGYVKMLDGRVDELKPGEEAQAFNHNWNSRPVTCITDNAAHKVPPFMPGKARSQTTLVAL